MKKALLILLTINLVFSLILPVKAQLKVVNVQKEESLIQQILRLLLILLTQKFGIQIPETPTQPLTTPKTQLKPETPKSSTKEELQQLSETPACDYQHFYDLVIYDGSEAGVAAAIQARRTNSNIRVAIIEDTDWIGGQLSSQAVTTYDLIPAINQYSYGLTHELTEKIAQYYSSRGWSTQFVYSPEPRIGKMMIENLIDTVGGIDIYYRHQLINAEHTANHIEKIITKDSDNKYHCFSGNIFLEASGWGDLLLALPNSYQTPIGEPNPVQGNGEPDPENAGCLQKFTYTMMIKKYPNQVPSDISLVDQPKPETLEVPFNYIDPLRTHQDNLNHSWQAANRNFFNAFIDLFTGGYRTTPCTTSNCPSEPYPRAYLNETNHTPLAKAAKTGVNMGQEDYPLKETDILDKNKRKETICRAKLKTIQLLWWINNRVPEKWQSASTPDFPKKWGVEKEEGFNTAYNFSPANFCDYQLINPGVEPIINQIQHYMPQEPYLREGPRLEGLDILTFEDVGGYSIFRSENETRILKAKFDDQIAFADTFDFHGCVSPKVISNTPYADTHYFGIPAKSLVSSRYDNLLAAGLNISVDRVINAATRLTAYSIFTGEASGVLAAVALELNKKPDVIVNNKALLRYYQSKLIDAGVAPYYFPDVKIQQTNSEQDFFRYIQKSAAYKFFFGYTNGNFGPNDNMLRAQIASAITRLFKELGYDTSVQECDPNNLTFVDVPCEANYWDEVEFVYQNGITAGCAENLYCPNSNLTRAQAAIMFDRVIHKIASNRDATENVYQFNDINQDYVLHAINTMIKNGAPLNLIECGANMFCPNQPASRKFVAMLSVITYGNTLLTFYDSTSSTSTDVHLPPNSKPICLMVLTPARNIYTKECRVFPNSCLPKDWAYDKNCGTKIYL